MNLYGYVRVSDAHQNESRQLISMAEQGVPTKNIFVDKHSGKDFERKAYRAMLRKLRPDDCVILSSLDRLGRDYAAILEQWRIITRKKGADIVVLDMELLDTRKKNHDITGRLICDLVLSLLSYCAQKEHEHIRARQSQHRVAAVGELAVKTQAHEFFRCRAHIPKTLPKRHDREAQPLQVLRHLHRTPTVKGNLADVVILPQVVDEFFDEAIMHHIALGGEQVLLLLCSHV